jgi:hypothetical protein
MSRPIKRGLDYFPLAVRAFEDEKLDDLHYDHGPMAQHIYIRILMLVYAKGYFLEIERAKLVRRLHVLLGPQWIEKDFIDDVIKSCVKLALFDPDLFSQNVVTSKAIQKQFIYAAKRRKEVDISKYWLLDSDTMKEEGVLLSEQKKEEEKKQKRVNVNNNSINVDKSTQRKRKRERDILIKQDKSIFGFPKMHYLTKLIINRKYISEIDENIIKYNNLFEEMILEYGYENVLSGVNYLISYAKKPTPAIDDLYNFMKASLRTNLERFKNQESKGSESIEAMFKRFLQVD